MESKNKKETKKVELPELQEVNEMRYDQLREKLFNTPSGKIVFNSNTLIDVYSQGDYFNHLTLFNRSQKRTNYLQASPTSLVVYIDVNELNIVSNTFGVSTRWPIYQLKENEEGKIERKYYKI